QSAETFVALTQNRFRPGVLFLLACVVVVNATLGGDNELLATLAKRPTNQVFAFALGSVTISGIDEVHAVIETGSQRGDAVLVVHVAGRLPRHGPGTE